MIFKIKEKYTKKEKGGRNEQKTRNKHSGLKHLVMQERG